METPASPRLAISGLMQLLKSGEISKMQLFQQLAKLQSATTESSNKASFPAPVLTSKLPLSDDHQAFPTQGMPTFSPAFSFSVVGSSTCSAPYAVASQSTNTPVPAQFSLGAAVTPMSLFGQTVPNTFGSSRFLAMPMDSDPASMVVKPGATVVESDAEFLATGVSHDKAKQFSVQEWIANKSRVSASSQAYSALRFQHEQGSDAQAANFHVKGPIHEMLFDKYDKEFSDSSRLNVHESSTGTPHLQPKGGLLAGSESGARAADAEYVSHNYSHLDSGKHDDRGSEQQYLDFAEQFRDERDGNISSNEREKNGVAGNRNNTDGKFHARVTRWKSQKEAVREQMKQQLLQSELEECTFAPKINPKSAKVVAKLRGRQPASVSDQGLSVLQTVSERLYQAADNYRTREELAIKVKADQEAEIERKCTFKPKINQCVAVKAKYMTSKSDSPSMTAAAREAAAKELAECTFSPKVNGVRSEMVSAQLYLQQNIYERLSQPCFGDVEDEASPTRARSGKRRSLSLFGDDDDEDRHNLDVSWPRSSQDDISVRLGGKSRRLLSSSNSHKQGPRSVDAEQSKEGEEERARHFKNFIERQKFHEQVRHRRIEETKQQLTPGYKPTINKKSLALMENGRKGDFLERISTRALRREHDNVKKKTVRSADPNCTFKPAINQTSTKRKPRSITELSRGDLLRRETAQRLMKLKMEQEEMAALTFRPQLNRVSERYEGRLKILSSPDTYLQRIQQQSQAHTIKLRRALQEKEIGEFSECTFKPRTIEAPAYVQRIAKSVSISKALRAQQQAAARAREKPDWK